MAMQSVWRREGQHGQQDRRQQRDGGHEQREALTKDWDKHLELETLSFLQEAQGLAHAVLNDGLGWCSPKEGSLHFGSQWLLPGRIMTGFRGLERCGETLSSSPRIRTEDSLEFFHHDLTKVLQWLEDGGQLRSEDRGECHGECHRAAQPRPAAHPFSTPPSPQSPILSAGHEAPGTQNWSCSPRP